MIQTMAKATATPIFPSCGREMETPTNAGKQLLLFCRCYLEDRR